MKPNLSWLYQSSEKRAAPAPPTRSTVQKKARRDGPERSGSTSSSRGASEGNAAPMTEAPTGAQLVEPSPAVTSPVHIRKSLPPIVDEPAPCPPAVDRGKAPQVKRESPFMRLLQLGAVSWALRSFPPWRNCWSPPWLGGRSRIRCCLMIWQLSEVEVLLEYPTLPFPHCNR